MGNGGVLGLAARDGCRTALLEMDNPAGVVKTHPLQIREDRRTVVGSDARDRANGRNPRTTSYTGNSVSSNFRVATRALTS